MCTLQAWGRLYEMFVEHLSDDRRVTVVAIVDRLENKVNSSLQGGNAP